MLQLQKVSVRHQAAQRRESQHESQAVPLPSMLLADVQSPGSGMDEIGLGWPSNERPESSAHILQRPGSIVASRISMLCLHQWCSVLKRRQRWCTRCPWCVLVALDRTDALQECTALQFVLFLVYLVQHRDNNWNAVKSLKPRAQLLPPTDQNTPIVVFELQWKMTGQQEITHRSAIHGLRAGNCRVFWDVLCQLFLVVHL